MTLLSKNTNPNIKLTIYTKLTNNKLELDIKKYNEQYGNLIVKNFELSHDRFLLIDDEIYHIGASLKDLGKKCFAFSKMNKNSFELLKNLE